jgi:RHS repeat-associated protein
LKLDIPPGRNGLQPDLALQYNSQRAEDSIVGYGWTINIPYIQRLNKVGSQSLYNLPYFTSSIDGELATTSTSTTAFGAKVDTGTFDSYSFTSNVWTMYDKNGTRYTFGASDNAQQNDAASSTKIYTWMLSEVRDTNNNYVRYVYTKDNGQIYPSAIYYTGNGSTDGIFTISFTKSSRPDTYISYKPLFKVTTSYRITQITAAVNSNVVREYNLSYTSGNNGLRSLLSSVQENGYDANHQNQVTLPAMSFAYDSDSSPFVAPASTINVNAGVVVADANGDGINDETYSKLHSGNVEAGVISGGAGGSVNVSVGEYWGAAGVVCNSINPQERGVRYLDTNADGKADVFRGEYNISTGASIQEGAFNTYATSTGYSWNGAMATGSIPYFDNDSNGSLAHITSGIFGDINGDGLADYEEAAVNLGGPQFGDYAYLGNGSTWDAATTTIFAPKQEMPTTAPTVANSQLVDINGDGLADWVYSDNSNTYVLLNTGTGWESSPSAQWTLATSTLYTASGGFWDRGMRFVDINGDGLPDFVRAYQMGNVSLNSAAPNESQSDYKVVFINTGSGWATSSASVSAAYLPQYITTPQIDAGVWGGTVCYDEYANWTGNGQNAQDVLSTITYPQGGTATVAYSKSAGSSNPQLPVSILVTSSITTNDGLGTSAEKDYTYSSGQMYSAQGVRNQKFAGFAKTTETNAQSITTTYFDQGDIVSTGNGEQNDGYGQINHPYRIDVTDRSSNLLKQTFNRWDQASTSIGNTTFAFLGRQVTQGYASNSTHRDTATDYSYSTTTGNLTQVMNYGEVLGNSDGTFTDTGTDKSTETILYSTSTTTQATGLPYDDTVVDQSSNKVRETRHTYDGLALGNVSLGNETKTEQWTTGSTYASTTKGYDGTYGLVTQTRDPIGNLSTSTLDSKNLYIATTTNPLFQTTGYTYDYSTGKVKTTFDPNSRLYTTTYDGFGRPLTVNIPDPVTGATVTKTTYANTDSSTPGSTSVTQTDYLNSATSSVSYLYFDGLNRKLQSRKTAENSNYLVKDWTYNNVGLLNTESLPYFASGSSRAAATTSAALFSTYTYDALQRVTQVSNAAGNTTNAYNAWSVTTTDPNGKVKDYIKDAYGNLATVVEHISGSPATTTYTYDLAKNLTKLTDSLGNVRNFTYDGLGNKLTAQDLHATGDSSFGTATSTYDVAGNLTQTIDPKSQTVNYTYDALNRVLAEDYTGGSGTEVSYAYDVCADGKGRLCAATTTDAVTNLTYNPDGAIASEKKTIDGTAYTTSYLYDRQGNVTDLTYPDLSVVKYGYDNVGLLDTIARKAPGGSKYVNAVQSIQYAPTGAVSNILFGSGVTTNKTYDANHLYRLIHINSVASTTLIGGGSGGTGQLGAARDAFSNFASANLKDTDVAAHVAADVGKGTLAKVTPGHIAVADLSAGPVVTLNIATTTKAPSQTPIADTLVGKPADVQAVMKGQEIAKLGPIARVSHGDYDIQIVSVNQISDGVEVFARAWDRSGQQIGFGPSGTVDIERFLIHNPPILVSDPAGPVVRTYSNPQTGENHTFKYREDVREALLQVLTHAISVKSLKSTAGNIVPGEVGRTTSIFFSQPSASSSRTSFDGYAARVNGAGESWSSLVNGVGTAANDSSQSEWTVFAAAKDNTPTFTQLVRGIFLFDTSALNDGDIVASGTVSLYGEGSDGTAGFMTDATVGIYGVNPASTTVATASDYQTFGTTTYSGTTFSFKGTWANGAYNNFPLNAAGLAAVSKTGDTKIGQRNANYDAAGVQPTWTGAGAASINFQTETADFIGTTKDPELIIETAPALTDTGALQDMAYAYDGNGNITQITDASHSNAGKALVLSYDDVNRLTTASTTVASSTPFSQTYTYNSIGDLTNKSDVGSYTYAGTGNANPHAPTTINGVTYTYDNNGNLTAAGAQKYTWDYRNRIVSAGNGTATSTYGYDHQNQRVRKVFGPSIGSGQATTTYPNKYMSKVVSGSAATTTDYIYMGDTIIAEIETAPSVSGGGGGTISTSTIAFDATSTSITTIASGTTTKTWTHTVTGTNPVIVLTADLQQTATGTGAIASATWNGGAFTKATSTRTGAMEAEVWYLVATTTGAKTLSVTINGSTTALRLAASSFTGVSPTWPLDITKSNNGNGGNPSVSVTPTMATDVVVSTLSKYGGSLGGGGGSTPAYVQSTKAVNAFSVAFPSNVTTGNLIVVGLTVFNQTIPSNDITDSKGNTYTKVAESINGTDHAAIFYAQNVTGGADTISSTVDGTLAIHEYSGIATTGAFDKKSTAANTSTKPHTGAATTTTANELYFGVAWSAGNLDTWTAGNGYTLRQTETDNNNNERLATEDQVISTASTSEAWYTTSSNSAWAAAIATFVPASSGGSGASADATSSLTTLFKDSNVATFGGASYKIATTSGTITDTWTTNASNDWVMAAIALRPATSTTGGGTGASATTTRYFLPDHLNSTNVVTDASGTLIQALDYYPYGSTRISQTTGGFDEQKQYIGQYTDPETNLSYLQARYYDGSKGDFLSEDPVFLGDPKQQTLTDPQSLNSYSYGNDDPITKSDPSGRAGFAASMLLGYGAGSESGPGDLVIGTGIGLALFAGQVLLANGNSGTPGFYQASQMVSGNGYNTDPKFPMNRPPGRWGGLILTTIASAYAINQGMDIANQFNDTKTTAQQFSLSQGGALGYDMPYPVIVGKIAFPQTLFGFASIGSSLSGLYGPSGHSACGLLCAPTPQIQAPPASRQSSPVNIRAGSAPAAASGAASSNLGSLHTACGTLCR